MKIQLDWDDFKDKCITQKQLNYQYDILSERYYIYANEGGLFYECVIPKETTPSIDQADFEDNYLNNAAVHMNPLSADQKPIIRSESKPIGTTTYFTCKGDSGVIGDGKELTWDFFNSDDEITPPPNKKRKRLEFSFLDSVYLKEGSIYFFNTLKGSYINLFVVCPVGEYYLDNNGTPQLATEDTIIATFVNNHFLQGDCPMGDELNTETCSEEIPNNYKFWIDITVPNIDVLSNGSVSLELYRSRTVVI